MKVPPLNVNDKNENKKLSCFTATSLVIANIIGTGIFVSLGFQAMSISSQFCLLFAWFIGGIIALCGALSYGELAAALPRSGGEYHFLSKIYRPSLGFLAGWVSATVGFSAPIAAAALALGMYIKEVYPSLSPVFVASSVVIVFTIINSVDVGVGSYFHNFFTVLKILIIFIFCCTGLVWGKAQPVHIVPSYHDLSCICSSAFAVSLVFIAYAYSGWNAATYITSEIENPARNLPRSLLSGTALVIVIYILINYIFLYTIPPHELPGPTVGAVAAKNIFGPIGGKIMSLTISIVLLSTISSMIIAGPRVTKVMGEDMPLLGVFAITTQNGVPMYAMLLQLVISLFFIITATFDQVLTYIGFTLTLFTALTVLGVFVLRGKNPNLPRPYRAWGYPLTPALFLLLNGWMLVFLLKDKPKESLAGFATVLAGLVLYVILKNRGTIWPN